MPRVLSAQVKSAAAASARWPDAAWLRWETLLFLWLSHRKGFLGCRWNTIWSVYFLLENDMDFLAQGNSRGMTWESEPVLTRVGFQIRLIFFLFLPQGEKPRWNCRGHLVKMEMMQLLVKLPLKSQVCQVNLGGCGFSSLFLGCLLGPSVGALNSIVSGTEIHLEQCILKHFWVWSWKWIQIILVKWAMQLDFEQIIKAKGKQEPYGFADLFWEVSNVVDSWTRVLCCWHSSHNFPFRSGLLFPPFSSLWLLALSTSGCLWIQQSNSKAR